MDIVGDRKFVEVPGAKTHELPPLLVHTAAEVKRLDRMVGMANDIVESEDMIPMADGPTGSMEPERFMLEAERRRMDLALNLVEQYLKLVTHWQWGDSILEWIRQCEITFGARLELRNLLKADVWPHAGRSSFVQLLADKSVPTRGVGIEKAVGLRLSFRQPPPISCCSNQFLFYLNSTVASTAYQTWASMSTDPLSSLPPERFSFQIVDMCRQ